LNGTWYLDEAFIKTIGDEIDMIVKNLDVNKQLCVFKSVLAK